MRSPTPRSLRDAGIARALGILVAHAALCGVATAQPNVVPGLDGSLFRVDSLTVWGSLGGTHGCGILTTSCNPGSVNIEWFSASRVPMDPRHPFIAFLIMREDPNAARFVQISDRSFLKHGFASTNSGACGSCRHPGTSSLLGANCSDTYGSSLNASRRHLGPADEIDPWTGFWETRCSYFDRGHPDVGPPGNCDDVKSLTGSGFDPIQNRCQVSDAELSAAGARYFYGSYYVFPKEAEHLRDNNSLWRQTRPTRSGSSWVFSNTGGAPIQGTPLRLWTGASIGSNTNGNHDGRVFVAVKVTGPEPGGTWHYEFAVHNRDNHRGVAAFRIPLCAGTNVSNFGSHDVDDDASNDWTVSRTPTELSFLAGANNALRWNTIFNFWFDADRGPQTGPVQVDAANPGPGAGNFQISSSVPAFDFNEYLGDGCGVPAAPTLVATGDPGRATIPNPTFGLRAFGMTAGNNYALDASTEASIDLGGGCTLFVQPALVWVAASGVVAGDGSFDYALAVPNNPSLEGVAVTFQAAELENGGALFGQLDLSNGLKVHVGNDCR